jgi:hypothetical protein
MEPDRLVAVITTLGVDVVAPFVRSHRWRAARCRERGKNRLAIWHETLADLVAEGEDNRRPPEVYRPLSELRAAIHDLSLRERMLLTIDCEAKRADGETYLLDRTSCLTDVICDELRRSIAGHSATKVESREDIIVNAES